MKRLEVQHLTGGYSRLPVLHDLNFTVDSGEIVGLIGLNGAGKSTTIKHIIGLLQARSGEILLNGHSLKSDNQAYRRSLAYIPEQPILYQELTLREHIDLVAMAYGIPLESAHEIALPLLKTFRLEDRLDWLPIHFSKGMRQKVMLVCALMVEASLYVIDEPFVGLDPLAIDDLIQALLEKKKKQAGILLTTHILRSAEHYCDRFVFLRQGRIQAMGNLEEIRRQFDRPKASLDELYIDLARGVMPHAH